MPPYGEAPMNGRRGSVREDHPGGNRAPAAGFRTRPRDPLHQAVGDAAADQGLEPPHQAGKKTTHARKFDGGTVEAEAIPANVTRRLVREAIEQHLDLREVKVMQAAEISEAEYLIAVAKAMEEAA